MRAAILALTLGCTGKAPAPESQAPESTPSDDSPAVESHAPDDSTAHSGGDSAPDDSTAHSGDTDDPVVPSEAPMVILFIGDGMGFEHLAGGGLYAYGARGALAIEGLPVAGRVRTASYTGITDSAAGATALSTGHKTWNRVLGMDEDGNTLENVREVAAARGLATGVVTRDTLTGATPAGFLVHQEDRGLGAEIAAEELANLPDVLMGGGAYDLYPLVDTALAQVVMTRTDLLATSDDGRSLVGLFADHEMPYVADTTPDVPDAPSLAEMTTAALSRLEGDPEGFFLMVEGARIDHASHANYEEMAHPETAALDEAVAAAIAWAEGKTNVTLLVTADHECGGMEVPETGVAGEIPLTTWRWGQHTNADVPVYGLGLYTEVLDGARVDNRMIHSVLYAAVTQTEVEEPDDILLVDGWTDDLGSAVTTQSWESSFGAGFNQLDGLRVTSNEDGLYIGVDGVFEFGENASLILLDLDYGAGTGLGSADYVAADPDGALDKLITALDLSSNVDGLGFDVVAGTVGGQECIHEELEDLSGLRGINGDFGDPVDFYWLDSVSNFDDGNVSKTTEAARDAGSTGATEGGYEVWVPWSELYPDGLPTEGVTIAIAALLTNGDGTYVSNQALPPYDVDDAPEDGPVVLDHAVTLTVDATGAVSVAPVVVP